MSEHELTPLRVGRASLKCSPKLAPREDRQPSGASFTLVEMLVVIAIIGILLGLLLSAVMFAIEKSRQTRAKVEVIELRDAWKTYLDKYHKLPPGMTMMDSNALATLRGANPHNIQHLDFRTTTQFYNDPWGTPGTSKGVYKIRLDDDADNTVVVGVSTIPVSTAAWSAGKDGIDFTDDDITSWE